MSKDEITEEKVQEFMKKFEEQGMSCGEKIGQVLKFKYPKSQIFTLYRSAIAIERKNDDCVVLYTAGDPHVWGHEITLENLTVTEHWITGDRFGPNIYQRLINTMTRMIAPNIQEFELEGEDAIEIDKEDIPYEDGDIDDDGRNFV